WSSLLCFKKPKPGFSQLSKQPLVMIQKLRPCYIMPPFFIGLLHNIISQPWRKLFFVLVHQKPNRLQAHLLPLFYACYPLVNAGIVGRVKPVSYKADKGMGCGQFHMHNVPSAGSIGYCGADF